MPKWNPFLVGIGIGLLSILSFALLDKPIGMSTGLAKASAACAVPVMGSESVAQNTYFAKHKPAWDFSTLFLLGTFVGALVSALAGATFVIEKIPSVWREHFGDSTAKRMAAAFLGGLLIMFGARMADGCTSGHGISGSLQLAVSSWTFFMVMFAAGCATAWLMFRKK